MEYDLPKEYNFRTLWEGRLTDLQRLLFLRHNGQLPPGYRDNWLLIASIAMSWLIHPDYLDREIVALAAQVANWSENEAKRNMGTVINKAMAAARGEKIAFNGLEVDPRYRFKTQSIIDFLSITTAEQEHMRALISQDMARKRRSEKKMELRRKQGVVERAEYLAKPEERRKAAKEMFIQGYTKKEIAEKLGVSKSTISRYLK